MRRPLTNAGRAHLKRRMLKLPAEMRSRAEVALESAADELVAEIRAAAPRRTGGLAESITKVPLDKGEGRIGWRVVGGAWGGEGWYMRFVEFGTKPGVKGGRATDSGGRERKVGRTHPGTPAQPFFWPTYRRLKARLRGRVTRALKKGAQEAQ